MEKNHSSTPSPKDISELNPLAKGQNITAGNPFFLQFIQSTVPTRDIQRYRHCGSFPLLFLLMTTPQNMSPYRINILSPHICQTAELKGS